MDSAVNDMLLIALNASYSHASLGARCLLANLGDLRPRAALMERTIGEPLDMIVDDVAARPPRVLALGIYCWNATQADRLLQVLRPRLPDTVLVIGGPEVTDPSDEPSVIRHADYVIRGEADRAFAELAGRLLNGERPKERNFRVEPPETDTLALPYGEYTNEDLAHRTLYAEASRGCPYRCAYCLSAIDRKVRAFETQRLFEAWDTLIRRGARIFKLTDRSLNMQTRHALDILGFFRGRPGVFVHAEWVPERLPPPLAEALRAWPERALQLEIGVQTWNPEVARRIGRPIQAGHVEANLRFLREQTPVYLHTDLIAGLPGEDLPSFAAGFNRLVALRPHEIQVGLLKRLRGTPMAEQAAGWGLIFDEAPPYPLIESRDLNRAEVKDLVLFGRLWDAVYNSGNFVTTAHLLWHDRRPFDGFMAFARRFLDRTGVDHGWSLDQLAEGVWRHLSGDLGLDRVEAARRMAKDITRTRPHLPPVLRPFAQPPDRTRKGAYKGPLQRQHRHWASPNP